MFALGYRSTNKKRPAGDCCAAYTSPTLEKQDHISPVSGSKIYQILSVLVCDTKIPADFMYYRPVHLTKEARMNTPYAILIGLALVPAAPFFRQPSIAPVQAGGVKVKYMDGFKCHSTNKLRSENCYILHEDKVIALMFH